MSSSPPEEAVVQDPTPIELEDRTASTAEDIMTTSDEEEEEMSPAPEGQGHQEGDFVEVKEVIIRQDVDTFTTEDRSAPKTETSSNQPLTTDAANEDSSTTNPNKEEISEPIMNGDTTPPEDEKPEGEKNASTSMNHADEALLTTTESDVSTEMNVPVVTEAAVTPSAADTTPPEDLKPEADMNKNINQADKAMPTPESDVSKEINVPAATEAAVAPSATDTTPPEDPKPEVEMNTTMNQADKAKPTPKSDVSQEKSESIASKTVEKKVEPRRFSLKKVVDEPNDCPTSPLPEEFTQTKKRLSKVDMSLVEHKAKPAPARLPQEMLVRSQSLRKVDIEKVEQTKHFAPALPSQAEAVPSVTLRKIDIETVEKTKNFEPSSPQSRLPSVALKKVDLDAIENKIKPAPLDVPEEVKKRSSTLRKVDIETVEKTKHFEPTSSATAVPAVALKKVDLTTVEKKAKPAPSAMPDEVTKRSSTLRKVDIQTVEKSKNFEPSSPQSKLPSIALKKVDLDAVEHKIKPAPLDVPDEVKKRSSRLRKVDIETVEKTKHFEPSLSATAMPAVSLKKVDLASVENKSKPAPSAMPDEVAKRSSTLRKVDIQTVEKTKNFEPSSPQSKLPSVALKKVDLDAVEHKIKPAPLDVPAEVKRRSSTLRKVDIQTVEKTKNFEPSSPQSKLPSVALKKVDLDAVEHKIKPAPLDVPAEVKRRSSTLRKVDIQTVEKTKNFEPSSPQSKLPSVALKKVDLDAVEHKIKPAPLDVPAEVKRRSSTLRKVDIQTVEKTKNFEPASPQSKLPSVSLKKIRFPSSENKVKPPPTEVPAEVKRRSSTLRKVDIQTVENTKNFEPSSQQTLPSVALKKVDIAAMEAAKAKFPPTEVPAEVKRRSSTLRKVDIETVEKTKTFEPSTTVPSAMMMPNLKKVNLESIEHKAKPAPTSLPSEMTKRSSTLRKVDIAEVEKGGYKKGNTETSKLPTVTLKKVQDRMSNFVQQ